ncbi:MAG: TonB-dependent receptor [Ferruginibacter sp.]
MKHKYYLLLLFFPLAAIAQQPDSSFDKKNLDEVVVTGQYRPQSVKNSVYQVQVISKERIQKQGASKLQDVLANNLNVRFSQDPATGGSDITLMGMRGQNVKILLDGMPLIGRQGVNNEISINQVDINSIERIEIIEGPMSVIYGADALAGVINIITKKAKAAKLAASVKLHEETLGKEYGSNKGIHNPSASLSLRHKNWETGGSVSYNYFGGFRGERTGRDLAWNKRNQYTGNGFVAFHNRNFNIRYRIDGLDEVISNPGNFVFPQSASGDTLAIDQQYFSNRVMHQLQAGYNKNADFNIQSQASFTNYNRQVFSSTLSKQTGDIRLDMSDGAQSNINIKGLTYRTTAFYRLNNMFSFQPGIDINTESGAGERLKTGRSSVSDYAFFITSEITPGKKVNIRPGLRFIKNSVYNAPPLIPSLNAKLALSKNLDLRLAYARGFRSPSLRELYFNFVDVNHDIIGNPDLKAETSHSFNLSLNYKRISPKQLAYSASFSSFYNNVKNLIDFAPMAGNPSVYLMQNISNSKTAGVSVSSFAKYKTWNFSAGGSYTGFYNVYSETEKNLPQLQWSPEINSTIGYGFAKIGLDANLFYKFTGKRRSYVVQGADLLPAETESFQLADLTFNKKILNTLSLNAGIRNLFDVETVYSTATNGVIHASNAAINAGTGRSYFLGLLFNWEKN